MKQYEYPRTAYTLTSNYNVRKVTLVKPFSKYSMGSGYTSRNVFYAERDLFDTPAKAIKAGRSMINRRLKAIAASHADIFKKIDALNKAEAAVKASGASGRAQRTNNNESIAAQPKDTTDTKEKA